MSEHREDRRATRSGRRTQRKIARERQESVAEGARSGSRKGSRSRERQQRDGEHKLAGRFDLLGAEYDDGGRKIVFVETKRGCDQLARSVKMEGFQVHCIHGDKSQEERDWALREFREGRVSMLVATDVAARGLDISGIDFVVHYQLPRSTETYVHRSGRTARASAGGLAIALVEPSDQPTYKRICRELE